MTKFLSIVIFRKIISAEKFYFEINTIILLVVYSFIVIEFIVIGIVLLSVHL
jgi:hypothetical protein